MRSTAKILSPILVLAMLFSAVAVLAPPRVTTVEANGGLQVICVPWKGDEGLPHPAYNGKEVTLKAIVRYSGEVHVRWAFGDMTNVTGAVTATDEYPVPIEAKHTYAGPVGTEYVATLTVTSGDDPSVSASDTYRVRILEESREVKADIAIDEGLWWLYKQQYRYSDGGVDFGSWLAGDPSEAFVAELQANWPEAYAAANEAAVAAFNAELKADYPEAYVAAVAVSQTELATNWPEANAAAAAASVAELAANWPGALAAAQDAFVAELAANWPDAFAACMAAGMAANPDPSSPEFQAAFQAELLNWPATYAACQGAFTAELLANWPDAADVADAAATAELAANWPEANAAAAAAFNAALEGYPEAQAAAEAAGGAASMAELEANWPDALAAAQAAAAGAGMYGVAHTAAAVEAFENNLHKPFGDPTKDPYVDCVRRGLNYLTSMMEVVSITDGDTNGNGIGISCYWDYQHEIYEAGIAMMTIVSSDTPGYEALAGPAGVIGRTLRDIVQDMADFFAFAQDDGGFHEGGWRYHRNFGNSDNSCTQWPVLAMDSAEAKWGITIPGFVRTRLEGWLNRTQNANGGFGYESDDDWLNIAKTAGTGITGLLFCGVGPEDDRIQRAVEFIDANWSDDNFGNGYAMYGVMKAFCVEFLNEEVIPGLGGHNWWQEYVDALVPGGTWGQQADGRWNAMDWAQSDELTTAWMIMILTRALYDVPPTAVGRANGFDTTEVEAGQDVSFDGSQSTNGSYEIVLYEWDWQSDGTYDYSSADPDATHSYPLDETYEVTLRVTDNRDVVTNYQKPAMTATDTCTVWVHPPPHDPIADANGPYGGWPDGPVTLDGSGSFDPNPEDEIVTWEWDLDNDGVFDDASGEMPQYAWADGIYPIALRVISSNELDSPSEPSRAMVVIGNHDPVADANGPYFFTTPGEMIELDGSASYDPDEEIEEYIVSWDWDLDNDGVYDDASGETVLCDSSIWSTPGVDIVRLRVTDTYGATDTDWTYVGGPPQPDITEPPDNTSIYGETVITAIDLSGEGDTASTSFEYWVDTNQNCETDEVDGVWNLIDVDQDGSDGWGVTWDTTAVDDGCYIIRATMEDNTGLTGATRINVSVYNQPYWTVMLYMAGDNDFDEAAVVGPGEIEAAQYIPGVQLVGLWDGGRWANEAVIFARTAEGIVPVDDEGMVINPETREVNMGHPQTLVDFVTWAKVEYPAPNYALVLWDHGWRSSGGLCQDQTDNDSLTVRELGGALGAITSDGANKLQVVGFDAGLMQMLEVDYQIREYAEYAVGSQGVGAVESWPYGQILTELALHPAKISAADLASLITQEYDAVYMGAEVLFPQGTMSAKDLTKIGGLATTVDAFAAELINSIPDYEEEIAGARTEVETFGQASAGSIDLYHFAELVATALPDTSVATAAQAVMAAVEEAVIANSVGSEHPNAHGIAIYYPDVVATGSLDGGEVLQFMFYDPSYDVDADFSTATRWAEYLKLAPRVVEEGILGLYIPDVLILAHVYEDAVIRLEWPAVSQDIADFTLAKPVDIIVTPEGAIDIGMVVLPYTQADLDDAGLLKTQLIGISGYDYAAQAWELEKLTMDLPSWLFDLAGMFGGLGGMFDGVLGQDVPQELRGAFGSLAAAGQAVGDGGGGLPDYVGAVVAIPWLDLSNVAPNVYELLPNFPTVSSAETTSLAMIATNREDYLTPIQYPQNLYQGWNLVSLPVIPLDSHTETVLSGYDGLVEGVIDQVEVVWGYDAAAGEWYAYGPEAPEASELTALEDGEGYWFKMSGDATLTVIGSNFLAGPHVPPDYDVVPGWNLIGYKGILPMPPQGDWIPPVDGEAPVAEFSATPTSGAPSLEVQFTDDSTGDITGWQWDFDDDGVVDSTEQNPSYTYDALGEYTVSLKVTGPGGSDTETRVGYIEVYEGVVITLGYLTDLTGPASPALVPTLYPLQDLVRYVNEEGLIPGVELRLAAYDTKYDPARVVPGYDWCRDQGAEVIFTSIPQDAEILKPFAERDKVAVVSAATTEPLIDPPGWVFCIDGPVSSKAATLLKWISENHWDYGQGIPKVGLVGWRELSAVDVEQGMREYCQDHPEEFEYVGGYLAPVGTMTWAGEVEALKDCDYICAFGFPMGAFMREFVLRGYTATFIDPGIASYYRGFLVDQLGWEALDGTLTAQSTLWWGEPYPIVELAEELLYKYHPAEAEELIYAGLGYVGGIQQSYPLFDILGRAIDEVGAQNFDGQAFYDAAVQLDMQYEGLPPWDFTETKRYAADHVAMYEWRAEVEDLVRISDWYGQEAYGYHAASLGSPYMDEVYLSGYLDTVEYECLLGYDRVNDTLDTPDALYPNEGYWLYATEPGSILGLRDENWVKAVQYGRQDWLETAADWIGYWMMRDGDLGLRLAWNAAWYGLWVIAPNLEMEAPVAQFGAIPTSGAPPLEVQFIDESAGDVIGWQWDFDGDGIADSTEQNPSHVYHAPGEYTVSLRVTGPGGSDAETKVGYIEVYEGGIITLGYLTDVTGPAAPALVPFTYALQDLVRYVNEEGLIPGVELKLVIYDTKYDPARVLPGYEWLRERGAEVILTPLPEVGEILKPFAERDHLPVVSAATTFPQIEPPGWVFCIDGPVSSKAMTLLKWISEAHWDYEAEGRRPKIGLAGWNIAYQIGVLNGLEDYCQANPDKFEWVGGYLAPVGTMTWAAEADKVKDCDYVFVPSNGIAAATFVKEFRARGYTGCFIGTDALSAYRGLLVDAVPWEDLDGMLTAQSTPWWNEPYTMVDLAKELMYKYRPGEAEDLIHSGLGYLGGIQQSYLALDVLRAAVEQVGGENFDGQAFYDAAIGFETTWEGYPQWGFTETKRYAADHVVMYEWSAAVQDLVRVSDWLPLVEAVAPEVYTLTMAVSGSGITTPAVGAHDYAYGTVVTVTATPDAGWQFDGWSGDVADPNSPITTVTMDGDKTVSANFSPIMHTLTMAVDDPSHGTTSPAAGEHSYACGTLVNITATAEAGWEFASWTTDGDIGEIADPNSATTTVTVDANKTVTANFTEAAVTWTKYDVTVNATVGDPPTGGSWSDLELCSGQMFIPDVTTYDGTTVFELWVSEETFTDDDGETYHLTKVPQESFTSPTTCMSMPALMAELATTLTLEADVEGRLYTSSGALVDFRSETTEDGSVNTYSNDVTTDSTGHYISTTPFHTVAKTYIIGAMGAPCRDPVPGTDTLIATTILPMMNTTGTAQNTILAGSLVQCTGFGAIDEAGFGPGHLTADSEGTLRTGAAMDLEAGTGTWVATYAQLTMVTATGTSDMRSEQIWELTLTPQV